MKRLLVLLTLMTLMLAVGVFAQCTETDDGKDFAVKGTTTYSKGGMEISKTIDQCLDESILEENFCDSDGKSDIERYECPKGCEDGACIGMEAAETPEEVVKEEVPAEEPKEVIPEETPETQPEVTPTEAKSYTWIAIVAVLVIIGIAVVMFLKMKKKKEVKKEIKGKK